MDEQEFVMQPIAIVRGTTNSFVLTVKDESTGDEYELLTGEFFRFGVKLDPTDANYAIVKTVSSKNANDEYEIKLSPDDTIGIPFGTYYYDVGMQSGVDYYPIIKTSPFELCANVTKWGAV